MTFPVSSNEQKTGGSGRQPVQKNNTKLQHHIENIGTYPLLVFIIHQNLFFSHGKSLLPNFVVLCFFLLSCFTILVCFLTELMARTYLADHLYFSKKFKRCV